MPFIRVEAGPLQGREEEVVDSLVVGRDPDADFYIPSPEISRHHCRIYRQGGNCFVADMGSRNGTVVNGVYRDKAELSAGDEIRIGKVVVRYTLARANTGVAWPVSAASDTGQDMDVSVVLDASGVKESLETLGHQQALARLRTFYKVSQTLAVHTDEQEIFPQILQCLLDIFPQAARAYVLIGEDVASLQQRGRLCRDAEAGDAGACVSTTILKTVMDRREAVLSTDAASDERFAEGASIIQQNIHTMICAPLIAHEEILGVIEVDSSSVADPFNEDDLNLLMGVASQVALFLRNIKLATRAATEQAHRRQLERFFSPAVARTVIDNQMTLGGELREGVVMFCDIVGFTPMSETTDPPELVRLLNMYLGAMVTKIRQTDGTVDKFGGDAILCVWGAPAADPADANHALLAAFEMQNAMVLYNRHLAELGVEAVGMGVGLHAGDFIAGNIGSEDRMEYTVIGNHVNIAQRIETTAARGMIIVSEDVCQRVNGRLLGTLYHGVSLKGARGERALVCVRGLATDTGTVLSMPVELDGAIPAKLVSISPDRRQLGLLSAADLEPGSQVNVICRTPERPDGGSFDVQVIGRLEGRERCWACACDQLAGILPEMLDHGVLDSGVQGIPWHRS